MLGNSTPSSAQKCMRYKNNRVREFIAAADGAIAIEFALLAPLLISIFFATIEASRALDVQRKIENIARTIADLTAQGDTQNVMSSNLVNDILASSKLIANPYDASKIKVVISALGVMTTKDGLSTYVCSSFSGANAKARSVGKASDLSVPQGYQIDKMRYLIVELDAPYAPFFGSSILNLFAVLKSDFSFKSQAAWPVRAGKTYNNNPYNEIVLPNGKPCPSTI